jgi:hypothetical protein
MPQQTPLYIITSPHPRVGKTLLARLLIEFLRSSDRPLFAYDLNPREPALAGRFPNLVLTADIADTRGQMELFDRLIGRDSITKVIDVGYGAFDQFFTVAAEIGFAAEARRRQIEPVVLFVIDRAPATVRAYAELRRRLTAMTFVPVHNEAVSVIFETEDFPPSRCECRAVRIPRLTPIVRGVLDRPSFSFSTCTTTRSGGPTVIDDWMATVFTEFRELELRLMMGRLTSAIGATSARATELRKPP